MGSQMRAPAFAGQDEVQKPELADESEAIVLLLACGIGLFTGAGVVAFNIAIESIRDIAFPTAPVQSVAWGLWARQLSFQSGLLIVALPPTVGGLTVGLFRYLVGGFSDKAQEQSKQGASPQRFEALALLESVRDLGSSATRRLQRRWGARTEEDAAQRTRLDSGGAASTSDPGSRDFVAAEVERSRGEKASEVQRSARAGLAPVWRTVAAAITLGSGCSLGPEGPSVEIGRSFAKTLGRLLRSKKRRLLPLLAAGSGAGVAAGFNAPISGVFFAVESVLQSEPRNSETEARNSSGLTVAMVLLAAVLAAIVSQAGLGDTPAFRVPPYQLQSLWELPLVMVLGGTCGLVSVGFSYSSQPLVWSLLPAMGGLCTGLIALVYPEILYQGFGNVNALLELKPSDYPPTLLLQMLGAKVFATAVCRGSGLVGGIYAPSIFMGAALGSAFGGFANIAVSPTGLSVAAPAAYALVGVAGMLAANCQVPLTAVLLLFELTHDYFIIVPTLAAVGISYWTASLPIAAELSARLRASAGPDIGAVSVSSADGDNLGPGKPLISRIRIAASSLRRREDFAEGSAQSETVERSMPGLTTAARPDSPQQPGMPLSPALDQQQAANARGEAETSLRINVANGAQPPRAEGAATAALVDVIQELTAECAVQDACVMVEESTPLAEALLLLDQATQTAALVLDSDRMVVGVLTRERILAALEAEAECRVVGDDEGSNDTSPGCTVELVVGAVESKKSN